MIILLKGNRVLRTRVSENGAEVAPTVFERGSDQTPSAQRCSRRLCVVPADRRPEDAVPLKRDGPPPRAALGQESETATGTLRFTAPSTFAQLYIVPLLPEFLDLHPGINLDLRLSDAQYDLMKRAHQATPGSRYVEVPGPDPERNGWVGFATEFPNEYADAIGAFLAGT